MTGKNKTRQKRRLFLFFLWASAIWISYHPNASLAIDLFDKNSIKNTWGGYVRLYGSIGFPDEESVYNVLGHDQLHDGSTEFRIHDETQYASRVSSEIHIEVIGNGGETIKVQKKLADEYSNFFDTLKSQVKIEDDRRLMDLTHVLTEKNEYYVYDRIDRLMITVRPDWGSVSVGRQAVTWGNGFLFNPMDLFNPFSPTDVVRDYKIGDDMAYTQAYVGDSGDFQALYVPRRKAQTHDIQWGQSALAGKYHFSKGRTEFDFMAGHNYSDEIGGIGATGYLMEAAWRVSSTYTNLDDDTRRSGFADISANMDYSWVWWSKNLYGWMEIYYTGLGNNDVEKALQDPDIVERLIRGERFTTGRIHMDTQLQIELHPLVNFFTGFIINLYDSSGIVQPRIVWDVRQNLQVITGGNVYYGGNNTEFGGFEIPLTNLIFGAPDLLYAYITWYF